MSKQKELDPMAGNTLPVIIDLLMSRGYKIEYPLSRRDSTSRTVRLIRLSDGEKMLFKAETFGKALRGAGTYVIKGWF